MHGGKSDRVGDERRDLDVPNLGIAARHDVDGASAHSTIATSHMPAWIAMAAREMPANADPPPWSLTCIQRGVTPR